MRQHLRRPEEAKTTRDDRPASRPERHDVRALELQRRAGNRVTSATLQRTPAADGAAPVVQRLLDKNATIQHGDVQSVTNPHGLVYLLRGFNQDGVVVKWELPGGAETLQQFAGRFQAAEELATATLSGSMVKNQLTAADVAELRLINVAGADAAKLQQDLANGIATAAVGVKMDLLAMGESLFDLNQNNVGGANDAVLDQILTPQKCVRYGEMAYFDLLTRNFDRFDLGGQLAAKNIDFDVANQNAVPLDNVYAYTSLTGPNSVTTELAEMDQVNNANRATYARNAIRSLIAASGRPFNMIGAGRIIATAERKFVEGIIAAEGRAVNVVNQWQRIHRSPMGRGRVRPEEHDAQAMIIARFDRANR